MRRRYRTNRSPNSMGSIMRSYGLSAKELQEALRFQLLHQNLKIGEICVLLGFVPRWIRDAALAKQRAASSGAVALMRLAKERTQRMNSSLGGLTDTIRRAERGMK